MRRYLIPLSMAAGCFLWIILGIIFNIAVDVSICIGAVFGIIGGSIAQSIVNEITPDEYFKNAAKVEKIKRNAIEIENIDDELPTRPEKQSDIGDTMVIRPIRQDNKNQIYSYRFDENDDVKVNAPAGRQPGGRGPGRGEIPPPKEPVKKNKKVVIEEEDD